MSFTILEKSKIRLFSSRYLINLKFEMTGILWIFWALYEKLYLNFLLYSVWIKKLLKIILKIQGILAYSRGTEGAMTH